MHETDVDLAVLDPDKSMVAEMVVDGKMRAEGAPAVFQCALMYTRSDGVRALRIHTVTLPTTKGMSWPLMRKTSAAPSKMPVKLKLTDLYSLLPVRAGTAVWT